MERLLLSFLGTGNYQPVSYHLGGVETPPTPLAAAALAKLFPEHLPVLLTTREAYEKNWGLVEGAFGELGLPVPERVEIPSGRSEAEIWAIVERLVARVPEGASVVLDVTHGFRALPLLVAAAMGLLIETGRASVERVLYGAFEARDEDGRAPFFDLSPLLALESWARALADLQRYGYAARLRDMLRNASRRAYQREDETAHLPRGLVGLGTALEELADALALLRPAQAHEAARRLAAVLPEAEEDLRRMPDLRPVAPFLKAALARYLELGEPEVLFTREGMPALARMIRVCLELEQYPQAITLAREALVTLRTLDNKTDPLDPNTRRAAEGEINSVASILKSGGSTDASPRLVAYAELWNALADLRNDVDHAGFRRHPRPADTVRREARELGERVAELLEQG